MRYILTIILVLLVSIPLSINTLSYTLEQKTIDSVYGIPPKVDIELPTGWEEKSQPKYGSNGEARGMFEFNSTHIFVDYKSKIKADQELKDNNTKPIKPQDYYVLSANGHNEYKPVQTTIIKSGQPAQVDTATYVYIPSLTQICSNDKIQSASNNWYEVRYGSYYYYFQATSTSNVTIDTNLYNQSVANNINNYTPPIAKSYAICWDKPLTQEELSNNYKGQDSLTYLFNNNQLGDAIIQFKVCTSLSNRDFKSNVDSDVLSQLRKVVSSLKKKENSNNLNPITTPSPKETESGKKEDIFPEQEVELEFQRSCQGIISLNKKRIGNPVIVDFNKDEFNLTSKSASKNSRLRYRIWYDNCHWWGGVEKTTYIENSLNIPNVKLTLNKNTISPFDQEIDSRDVQTQDEQEFKINKNDIWQGDLLYLKQTIFGQFEENLNGYGKVNFEFKSESDKSNSITIPESNAIFSVVKSFSTGFIDSIASIPGGLAAPFEYYMNKDKSNPTAVRDFTNIVMGVNTLATGVALSASACTATVVLAPICGPIAATAGLISVGTLGVGLATNLATNNEGNIQGDIGKNIQNNAWNLACGQYGGQYNSNQNSFEITNPAYCFGNTTGVIATLYGAHKISEYIGKTIKEPICISNAQPQTKILDYLSIHTYLDLITIKAQAISCLKLAPEKTYITGEFKNHIAKTDSKGRLSSVETDSLRLSEQGRQSWISKTPGKIEGDHAGHLIADMFGGSGNLDNLVSMKGREVNWGQYRDMERN